MVFEAWRARGVPLLVAPVTFLGGSVGDVRLFLMLASAVTITATFRLWIPSVGLAAPVAAWLFSFSWLGLWSGSEVMPNLWAAILGLATAGFVARYLDGGERWHAVLAAIVLAAMALVRPTEATVLTGAIGLYVVVFRRARWRLLFGLGLGLVLGWVPWLIEMSIRFGGPMSALDEAAVEHFAKSSGRGQRPSPSDRHRWKTSGFPDAFGGRSLVGHPADSWRSSRSRERRDRRIGPLRSSPASGRWHSRRSTSCSCPHLLPGSCYPRTRSARSSPRSAWSHCIRGGVVSRATGAVVLMLADPVDDLARCRGGPIPGEEDDLDPGVP